MLVNFKTTLAALDVKQVDLALELKVPPSTISEIICGRRQADASLRSRIAAKLGVDESWLFSSVTRIPGLESHRPDHDAVASTVGI